MSRKEPAFEQALARLEEIVSRLEGGELGLEESLKLFEEGVRLARLCGRQLEEAEQKVRLLVEGPERTPEARPPAAQAGSGPLDDPESGDAET